MRTVKGLLVVMSIILSGWISNSLCMAADEDQGGFSGSIGISISDKYHSDSGLDASEGKAVYQPDIFLAHDSEWGQFSVEFWGSFQFDGVFQDEPANETDFIISWRQDFGWAAIQVGFNYIDCAQLFAGKEGDVAEWIFELNRKFSLKEGGDTLTPYIRLEWNELIGEGDTSSNLFVGLLYGHNFTEDLFLNSKVAVALDDGKDTESGMVGVLQGGLSYALLESVVLDVAIVKVTTPMIDAQDRDTEVSVACGVTYNF